MRRGQIRTAVLALLAEGPMHGYEMIRTFEERSGGRWKPSAGAVYPTLAQLDDEGLVVAAEVDGKRVYELTEDGRLAVGALAPDDREPWVNDAGGDGAFELKGLLHQLGHAVRGVMQSGTPDQVERTRKVLADARRSIWVILAEEPTDGSGA